MINRLTGVSFEQSCSRAVRCVEDAYQSRALRPYANEALALAEQDLRVAISLQGERATLRRIKGVHSNLTRFLLMERLEALQGGGSRDQVVTRHVFGFSTIEGRNRYWLPVLDSESRSTLCEQGFLND